MNIVKTSLLICAIAVSGCTTMQNFSGTAGELADELKPGEAIVVHEKSGRVWAIQFEGIENNELRGISEATSAPAAIPLADIDRIEAKRIDGLRTSLFVAGTAASVVVLVAAIEAAGAGLVLNSAY